MAIRANGPCAASAGPNNPNPSPNPAIPSQRDRISLGAPIRILLEAMQAFSDKDPTISANGDPSLARDDRLAA